MCKNPNPNKSLALRLDFQHKMSLPVFLCEQTVVGTYDNDVINIF